MVNGGHGASLNSRLAQFYVLSHASAIQASCWEIEIFSSSACASLLSVCWQCTASASSASAPAALVNPCTWARPEPPPPSVGRCQLGGASWAMSVGRCQLGDFSWAVPPPSVAPQAGPRSRPRPADEAPTGLPGWRPPPHSQACHSQPTTRAPSALPCRPPVLRAACHLQPGNAQASVLPVPGSGCTHVHVCVHCEPIRRLAAPSMSQTAV
jgi:hypothetical protein